MEISVTKVAAAVGLIALGAGIGKLASQSSIDLQQGKLVDLAKELEGPVLLLKAANREHPGNMSDREEGLNHAILEDVYGELKKFQEKNKPMADKAADKVNDGVDTGINIVGRVWGGVKSLFTRKKKDDKAEKTDEAQEPAVAS